MRRKLVVGNWKMHGNRAQVTELLQELISSATQISQGVDVGVCPSFVHLGLVKDQLAGSKLILGAQDLNEQPESAVTGEVAGSMLFDLGVRYVIVGHSERRSIYQETSEVIADKVAIVLAAGLTPILCAFCYSLSMIIIKKTSDKDSVYTQTFTFYLGAIIISSIFYFIIGDGQYNTTDHPASQFIFRKWFDNLEFRTAKDIILNDSKPSLEELSAVLLERPTWVLEISGHTDNVGDEDKNMVLSKKRAESVKRFLTSHGVDESHLIIKFFGETKPIEDNTTSEGRQKNRRVEMKIIFE